MTGRWLVNDQLGALGERTFWHELRDHCGLEDHSGVPFGRLADKIEREARDNPPRLIVRNASYFRPLNIPCRTISIAQDIMGFDIMESGGPRDIQRAVMSSSDVVVFNSNYTALQIGCPVEVNRVECIPIGTDFNLFHPPDSPDEPAEIRELYGIADDSVLFVGSGDPVKGFDFLQELIAATSLNFVVVTKDDARIRHARVRNFGRVSQPLLRDIMVACSVLVCTSVRETQHLAGIEAAACGLPVVAPRVGVYHDVRDHQEHFGKIVSSRTISEYEAAIRNVLDDRDSFGPREFFLSSGFNRPTCAARWNQLLDGLEAA